MKLACCRGLFAVLLLVALACPAEFYRWVDEKGHTHFADRPQHSQPHEIAVRPAAAAPADAAQRRDKTRRLLNAFQVERQQQREAQVKRQEETQKRRRNCVLARDNLRQSSEAGNIYRLDASGNRVYLSEPERAAAIRRHQQAVAEWCD
jgi:E3 ubiquitin-protein ligase DOA10